MHIYWPKCIALTPDTSFDSWNKLSTVLTADTNCWQRWQQINATGNFNKSWQRVRTTWRTSRENIRTLGWINIVPEWQTADQIIIWRQECWRTFGNRLKVSLEKCIDANRRIPSDDFCVVFSLFFKLRGVLKDFWQAAGSFSRKWALDWRQGHPGGESQPSPMPNSQSFTAHFNICETFFAHKLSKSLRLIVNLQWDWV